MKVDNSPLATNRSLRSHVPTDDAFGPPNSVSWGLLKRSSFLIVPLSSPPNPLNTQFCAVHCAAPRSFLGLWPLDSPHGTAVHLVDYDIERRRTMASLPEDTLHQTTPASPHAGSAQMLDFHLSPSVISSRMTNIISEDGDAYRPEGPAGAAVQSQARVSAEGSTRPASSQPEPWNSSSTARHGLVSSAGSGNGRGINAFGGPGVSMSNSSRPQSAVSRVSRISRTHVPSVASRAFFRPMSSQRLQAQRGGRTLTSDQSLEARDGTKDIHDSKSSTNPRLDHVDRGLPPPSAGTDITEDDPRDRTSANASPTGTATIWSAGKSTRLLHSTFSQPRQPHHHTVPDYRQEPGVAPQNPKPNVSFRSNFLLPIRRDPQISTRNDRDRNIHAASDTLFSRPDKEIVPPHAHDRTNRNHHYFSGNTAFIWGGRLQNTREKPINVATGTLVVLPCILFLIFSCVLPFFPD